MSKLKKIKENFRRGERGNVLFLILIAVALFAALSYAVTSSSRSGGGDANDESALVRSAQITQYPSSIRTSLIRMMVSNSVDPIDLIFAGPADFDTECDDLVSERPNCVFHPGGGGATLTNVPADLVIPTATGEWYFSANYEILDIGTSVGTDPDGNDIIAFLPGITNGVCDRINEELGITGDTTDGGTWDVASDTNMDTAAYVIPNEADVIGGTTAAEAVALTGQAFGCMTDSTGLNIYYHAVLER